MTASSMPRFTLVAPGVVEQRTGPAPRPLPGTVVVRSASVGLCGSDLLAYRGKHPRMVPPLVLGHEFAGTVEAVADDVDRFAPGDRVAVNPVVACGACPPCREGRDNICQRYRVIGCHPDLPGGLARYVRVVADRVHPIPDTVSFDAAAVIQPLAVSYHATKTIGRVGADDRVLVVGAGPIGIGCVIVARAAGAHVSVVDLVDRRREQALALGAAEAFDPRGDGPPPDDRFDVVLEAVGGAQNATVGTALRAVRRGGRVVVIGNFPDGGTGVDLSLVKSKEITMSGSQSYSAASYRDMLDLEASGRVDPEALVSHRIPFSETPRAFSLLADDSVDKQKIIIDCLVDG